jgi:hypothetical protein
MKLLAETTTSLIMLAFLALPGSASVAVADPPADPLSQPLADPGPVAAPAVRANVAAAFTLFELDGNATQEAVPSPDDWQFLYANGGNTGGHSVAFTGIVADPGNLTIFDGGKKDIQDIPQWGFKNAGGFPDKNDITNAYAAAYEDISGDLIVYFGADRFSNSGDAYLGFWFFKDRVGLNQATGKFSGKHQVGDVLVIVNYPQGANTMPELKVLEWNPPLQDVATNLRLLHSNVGPVCSVDPPSTVCATTNLLGTPSPWPYAPKSGPANFFPPESFFEGGINLTKVLKENTCFSSFMAETRSSTSVSATLKDFVLGDFPVCALEIKKTCKVVDISSDFSKFLVDFEATVENAGAGTFSAGSKLTVTDDAGTPENTADDVQLVTYLSTPLAPKQTVSVSGQFESANNPPHNTLRAVIETPKVTVQSGPYSVECEKLVLNPALELSKSCSLALESLGGMLVVRVDFKGHVKNTGELPLVVTVVDDKAGTVLSATLMVPDQKIELSGFYYPTSANGGVTDPDSAVFSDKFTATGMNPLLANPVIEMVSANCPLCPCK